VVTIRWCWLAKSGIESEVYSSGKKQVVTAYNTRHIGGYIVYYYGEMVGSCAIFSSQNWIAHFGQWVECVRATNKRGHIERLRW